MKVGLIGYGYWGKIISKYIKDHSQFELIKIYSPSLKDNGKYTNNLAKILSNNSIDAVFIASPLKTHYEIVRTALQHGKHVMCEKPLTLSYEEGLELKRISETKGVLLETDYTYMYSKSVEKMKQIFDRMEDIQYISLSIKQLGKFYEEDVFSILGSHMLSIVDYLLSLDNMDFTFNDLIIDDNNVVTTGEIYFCKNNIKGTIFVSLNSPYKERKITIYNKNSVISFDSLADNTLEYKKYSIVNNQCEIYHSEQYNYDESNNLKFMVDAFYNRIVNIERSKSNIETSLRITNILEKRK